MTSVEWGILFAGLFCVVVPIITSGIAVWVKLNTVSIKLDTIKEQHIETQQELKELWRAHNHQETRIYMQDRILMEVVKHLELDISDIDFSPKRKPNYKWD